MTVIVLMGARTYDQQFDEARLARLRRLPTTDPYVSTISISSTRPSHIRVTSDVTRQLDEIWLNSNRT